MLERELELGPSVLKIHGQISFNTGKCLLKLTDIMVKKTDIVSHPGPYNLGDIGQILIKCSEKEHTLSNCT